MTEPTELEVAYAALPTATTIRAALRQQLNRAVTEERARRGDVVTIEDTYEMHRALARVADTCGEYSRAFSAAAREAGNVAEEELTEVFGEQDGIPNQGITVPNGDGTEVKVELDIRSEWTADTHAIMTAVVYDVLREYAGDVDLLVNPAPEPREDTADYREGVLAGLMMAAMERLVGTGSFKPQVSKIRAFTGTLSGTPEGDRIASTVNISLRNSRVYKGVKLTTKETSKKGGGR